METSYFRQPSCNGKWVAEHRSSPYFRFEADSLLEVWQTVQRAMAFYRRSRPTPEKE